MNLRTARAERGAVQPKGYVSLSEAGMRWNVRWRATSQAQNPVKSPRQDFATFLTPVRVPQCRRRVQESGIVDLAAAEVAIHSSASSCCGTPSAATPGSAFSAASISTRRSSGDVLPHEFLKTPVSLGAFLLENLQQHQQRSLQGTREPEQEIRIQEKSSHGIQSVELSEQVVDWFFAGPSARKINRVKRPGLPMLARKQGGANINGRYFLENLRPFQSAGNPTCLDQSRLAVDLEMHHAFDRGGLTPQGAQCLYGQYRCVNPSI